jgi:hypothetical protein
MTHRLRLAVLAATALLAAPVRADTVRANSTTLFYTREDPYVRDVGGAQPDFTRELDRVAPIFEIVSVTATDVTTGFAEEVEIALSTWGAVDLADIRRWQNGGTAGSRASGDVDVGYVKGELLDRRLVLRVGRQLVAEGNARMVHLDGGEMRLRLPAWFGLSAYAGAVVPSRFAGRGGELATGNHRANFATGGRLSWFYPGLLEVGGSYALARDRGDVSRNDAGADLRLFLPRDLIAVAAGWYSLYEERLGEAQVSLGWRGSRRLQGNVDYRHVEPDLFLPRTSILSVFAEDERDEAGAAVRFEPMPQLFVDADYHALFEDADTGHRARVKGTWHPRVAYDVGGEAVVLSHPDDAGYVLTRAFAAWRRRAVDVTGDLLAVFLSREVNREDLELTATATVAYRFSPGWKVLLAASGGTNPFLQRHIDVLAKLVYDQTYVTREVP